MSFWPSKKVLESDDLKWLAFFVILIFPVLGNAVSYGWFDSRRPLQILFLLLGVGVLGSTLNKDDFLRLRPFIKGTVLATFTVAISSFVYLFAATEQIGSVELLSLQKGLFAFSFLFLFLFAGRYLMIKRPLIRELLLIQEEGDTSKRVSAIVFLIGLAMCFKAWWVGPLELQAHIDFGGSTTIVGLSSACAFFVILFSLPATIPTRFLVSLPYLYLLFFSTSRTAYVVFFTLWLMFLLRSLITPFSFRVRYAVAKGLLVSLVPVVALVTILAPLKLTSRFYPYYVSSETSENIWTYDGRSAQMEKVGYEKLLVYRQEELWNRLSRFIRALYNFYQSPIIRDVREMINNFFNVQLMPDILVGADDYLIKGGHNPDDRWARLAAQSTRGESRTQIIRKTNVLIKERPQGWWPTSYPSAIDFFCNKGKKCQYPHNIILESTFYFGIIMGLLYTFLLIFLGWIFFIFSVRGRNYFVTGLSVAILVHFFGAQFTGTYYDLVVTAFLLSIFVVYLSREIELVEELN